MAVAAKTSLDIKGVDALAPAARADLERRMRASRKRIAPYDPRARTRGDLETEAVSRTVDDPLNFGSKERVAVNRRIDILEMERSRGPANGISEAAFLTGRQIQAVFERSQLSGGSSWSGGDRVDAELAKEKRIIRNVDTARAVNAEMGRLSDEVGMIGARFLREILTGTSFAEFAARRGHSNERAVTDVAKRFRWMLEEIADARAARGRAA